MLSKLFLSFYLISSFFPSFALENSIADDMEKYEIFENLSHKKYSKKQLAMIAKALEKKEEKIRVVSYNILFNLYDHNLKECNRWPQRLPRIIELLDHLQPDVIGVQEPYKDQIDDLMPLMKDRYDFFVQPGLEGECCGIFFRRDRFELIDKKIWVMPACDVDETLTMITLRDRKSSKTVSFLNTHLAFSNVEKRERQTRFIADIIQKLDKPLIFMGDLNTFSQRLDISNLPFYDGDYIHSILESARLKDASNCAILGHLGPMSTFTNEIGGKDPFCGTGTPGIFLDHIYVSENVNVLIHAIEPATVDKHFPSDHMPVVVDFIL